MIPTQRIQEIISAVSSWDSCLIRHIKHHLTYSEGLLVQLVLPVLS